LFKFYSVAPRTGYRVLEEPRREFDRTYYNNSALKEARGRPPKLSQTDILAADRLLQDLGWDAYILTWDQLAEELDLDVAGETLRHHLGTMDWSKCIACTKGWVSQRHAETRKSWASVILDRYPAKENWRRVRFSDEVHWGVGPEGKMRLLRKPGERYCKDCI